MAAEGAGPGTLSCQCRLRCQLTADPVRTCVGCRRRWRLAERAMVRLVAGPGGIPVIGRTLPGRGAWLCADPNCLETALKRRTLGRALRCDVGTDAVEALRARFPGQTSGARDYEAPLPRQAGSTKDD